MWIEDRAINVASLNDAGRSLRLDLPAGRSFVTVVLHYTTEDALPALVRSIDPALPKLDVPVLNRHWLVWMPPGYGLFDADPRWMVEPVRHVTWSQRMFGPLGRPASEPMFDPLSAEQWRQWSGSVQPGEIQTASIERLLAAVAALGTVDRSTRAEKLTWGELLSRWQTVEPVSQLKLFADSMRLAEAEFGADTAVPEALGDDPLRCGVSLLTQSNLTLLVRNDTVLLTTPIGAALVREQLVAPQSGVACAIANGPLADELAAAAEGKSARLMNFDAWLASATTSQSPWTMPNVAHDDLSSSRGWNAAYIDLPQTLAPPIHVVRTAGMKALGWAICLAILAAGAWARAARAAPWMIAAGTLSAAALIVPVAWSLVLAPSLLAVLAYLARIGHRPLIAAMDRALGTGRLDHGLQGPGAAPRCSLGADHFRRRHQRRRIRRRRGGRRAQSRGPAARLLAAG